MSRRPPNGSNGYTNGYYSQEQSNRYEENQQDVSPIEESRGHRAGGYGGFVNDNLSAPARHDRDSPSRRGAAEPGTYNSSRRSRFEERDSDIDNSSRSRDRNALDHDNGRSLRNGPGSRQIEGVLEHIHENWDIMTQDDCLPVHVALQLMDHSSLGRGGDYQDFQKTSKQLQKALKAIVNEHHQGFNSSIGTFHKIQSSIQASQHRVRSLKESIYEAKSNLMVSKPELKGLGASSQEYEEMLQILGQIEKLQLLPEQLDAKISDKNFLSAVDVLQEASRMIKRSELENVGALTDLRVYFDNQESSLTDILIEELHDHLYLKSPYCQDRWKPYTPETLGVTGSGNGATLPNTWGRPLYRFLESLDTSVVLEDDASQNLEQDTFQYIYMVIESLNKLGRMDLAVDRMEQRLPIELFAIVDKTNQEVDQCHPGHLREQPKPEKGMVEFDLDGNSGRSQVLKDLLWTLYSKFEAIAEGHRAVHDVVAGIVKREGLRHSEPLTRGFKELWKLYQSEMRSLLHDYLATDANSSYRSGRLPDAEINIFQRNPRDKAKRIFKFAGIDKKHPDLAAEQEALEQILQTSVPGLVSKSLRRSGVSHNKNNLTNDGPAAGHKLLIEPNVFNISLLLPPSLSFLQRLKDIVPLDSDIAVSTLTSFLDDFLVNVFHPQLEETVTELCAQSLLDLDAFQQDPYWSQYAMRPIFRSTSTFFALIRAFCRLLDTIPQDQAFTQLIISQLVAYYDKCCGWYQALVTRAGKEPEEKPRLKTAAAMAETGDLQEIVHKIWTSEIPAPDELSSTEIDLLISKTNETPLEPFDIISDHRSVAALCLLYSSMQWLAARLTQFRRVTNNQTRLSQRDSSRPSQLRRWTALNSLRLQDDNNPVYLPMNPETVHAFDTILTSIRSLATTALLTLHLDIRLGIIHMLTRAFGSPYLLPQPAQDPDPTVLALNTDLLSFDDTLTTHLPDREHRFITTNLTLLVDTVLVRNAAMVGTMNRNGCSRMQLNVLVLQQNLKAVEGEGEVALGRSARFFDFFMEGAEGVVQRARDAADANEHGGKELGFSLEEMKVLVELCYSEGLRSSQREVAVQAKRGLSEHLLVLSEVLWNA